MHDDKKRHIRYLVIRNYNASKYYKVSLPQKKQILQFVGVKGLSKSPTDKPRENGSKSSFFVEVIKKDFLIGIFM